MQLKKLLLAVKNTSLFNTVAVFILFSYPSLFFTVKSSMGVLFGIMLIASLVYLFNIRKEKVWAYWDKSSILFAIAMASPTVAILLSQIYHGEFHAPSYDWASRFLLSVPIYIALRQSNVRTLTVIQYGMPLGALTTLIALQLDPHVIGNGGRSTNSYSFNLIHFGGCSLVFGILTLFSINRERKELFLVLLFKLIGVCSGLYIAVQSGERGILIAIPPLILLWIVGNSTSKFGLVFIISTLVIALVSWQSYNNVDVIHNRFNNAIDDINNFAINEKDTSIGVRLQLYLASLQLFFENPLFGIGPNNFAQYLPTLQSNGTITPLAAKFGYSEIHNEILAKCLHTGLFGLASILSIFLIPIYIFALSLKSSRKTTGMMGISLVLSFFIFGLTAEIFNIKMTATFFALTLSALTAAATHREAIPSLDDEGIFVRGTRR